MVVSSNAQVHPWRSGVQYQRLFKQRHKSGYFEVGRTASKERPSVLGQKGLWEAFRAKASEVSFR